MTIDTESPPGSWRRAIDFHMTSVEQLRAEIREQRERIASYLADIARLEAELAEAKRAQVDQWVREP